MDNGADIGLLSKSHQECHSHRWGLEQQRAVGGLSSSISSVETAFGGGRSLPTVPGPLSGAIPTRGLVASEAFPSIGGHRRIHMDQVSVGEVC